MVCGQDVPFKVNTGVEVKVVSEEKYAKMLSPDMKPPSKHFMDQTDSPECLG